MESGKPQSWLVMNDLDGDAGKDFIVLSRDGDLRAMRGTDGLTLWQASEPLWRLAWSADDLDGDGSKDLITFSVGEPVYFDGVPKRAEVDQVISARSGATGAVLWRRTDTLEAQFDGAKELDTGAQLQQVRNFAYVEVVDADTAKPSVFVELYDWDYADATVLGGGPYFAHASERALLLDGVTLGERVRIETSSIDSLPYTVPLADLDGDARSDLLVWEFPEYPAGQRTGLALFQGVTAFSGADGHRLWTADYFPESFISPSFTGVNPGYDPFYTFPLAVDARGRGLPDVLVVNYKLHPISLTLLAGDTGSELWRRPYGTTAETDKTVAFYMWTYLPGDLNDDGASDIVQFLDVCECPLGGGVVENERFRFQAISGTDGSELWSREVGDPDRQAVATPMGDFDGDGAGDLLLATDTTGHGGPYRLSAMSSKNGASLWVAPNLSVNLSIAPLPAGGDFNSDGLEDLAGMEFRPGEGTWTVAWSGEDAAELWSARDPLHPPRDPGFAVDVITGTPGPELIQPTYGQPPDAIAYSAEGTAIWIA